MPKINLAFIMWKSEYRNALVSVIEMGRKNPFKVIYSENKVLVKRVKELPNNTVFVIDELFRHGDKYVSGIEKTKTVLSILPEAKIICITTFEIALSDRIKFTNIGVKGFLQKNMGIAEIKAVIMMVAGRNPDHPANPLYVGENKTLNNYNES